MSQWTNANNWLMPVLVQFVKNVIIIIVIFLNDDDDGDMYDMMMMFK